MKSKLPVFVLALVLTSELTAKDGLPDGAQLLPLARLTMKGSALAAMAAMDWSLTEKLPPLAGSSWVAGPETRLIRIAMHGVRGPIQVGDMYDREMPGVGSKLADREMAAMLSFVRNRWDASSAAITPEAVTRVRRAAGTRTRYWTVEELLAKP